MNRIITFVAIFLLLAGAVAIAIMNTKGDEDSATAKKEAGGSAPAPTRVVPGAGTSEGGNATKDAERGMRERKDEDLVSEYGAVRTAMARQVSENVVSLLDDAIAMGEMMTSGAGQAFGGSRGMMRGGLGRIGIELNEEQEAKAMELYTEFQKRELDRSREAVESLRKDPSALMELFLAGDAKERGDLTDEEFAMIRDNAAANLEGVINPLDRNNFRGGRPLQDEQLMQEFSALLDDEQGATFEAFMDEQEANAAENPAQDGNISNIPTMELDTLDEAVTGAKKMTSGFRSVMEGMGSLQQLQPQIERQEGDGE
jgi:hypothetical protein